MTPDCVSISLRTGVRVPRRVVALRLQPRLRHRLEILARRYPVRPNTNNFVWAEGMDGGPNRWGWVRPVPVVGVFETVAARLVGNDVGVGGQPPGGH